MQDIEILLPDAFLFTFFIAVFTSNASVVNFTAGTCHVVQKKNKAHKMVAVGLSDLSSSDGSCDRIHVSRPLSMGSYGLFTSLQLCVLYGHTFNQLIRILPVGLRHFAPA
jgi:hypothetical protein